MGDRTHAPLYRKIGETVIMKMIIKVIALATLLCTSCSHSSVLTLSGLDPKDFEGEKDGKHISLYTLTNAEGMELCISNFGARMVSAMVPDRNGNMVDVMLGYDNINDYLTKQNDFGASIGRYANRIAGASFILDGETVTLDPNERGNCLHGGSNGWQGHVYDVEAVDSQSIKLALESADGEMGFPGNVKATVTYRLTDDNAIEITYEAATDKPTVVNMTNHAYFGLSGIHDSESTDMILYINADKFTPTDSMLIPTGEMRPVDGTPFDFRTPKAVGQDIDQDDVQLQMGSGYDHNWVLNSAGDVSQLAVSLYSPVTGILLETYTDQPGVQIYTSNYLTGKVAGKHGALYPRRSSVCIETQLYPNSPNMPDWPSAVLRPGETYTHRCIYKFSIK